VARPRRPALSADTTAQWGNPGVVDMFRAVVPAQGRRFTSLDLLKGGMRNFADTPAEGVRASLTSLQGYV
jgi:hypothetical protein